MLSDDRPTDPVWLPIFSKEEHFMGNAFGMIPGLEPDEWSNDACRGYVIMAMENCGFSKKDIRRVVGQLYEVFDLNSVEDAKEKYHSVLTDLGPHRPEVEKAQRAAPAGCRLLTFPHGTSGKGWHIHALSQRRFSMTQAVTYERETKSVAFQGKIIVLESLTPVLPPKEKAQRKKEIERCLYEVFRKYGDRFP